MPVKPFLVDDFFGPEVIETMNAALTEACASLGLHDKVGETVRVLAKRIIEEARAGVRDRALLTAAALRGLAPPLKH